MKSWLSRREREGWSWAELSRRSGLPVWTLRWWGRRLARRPASSRARSSESFVAVELVVPPSAQSIEVVTRSGHRVSVPSGFDEEHLIRLLRVLDVGC